MQEHTAKHLRISALIWLLLLALAFPYLIAYYERQQEFQWQEMVQPHWEAVNVSVAVVEKDIVEKDVADKNIVEHAVLELAEIEQVPEQEPEVPAPVKPTMPNENGKKKIIPKLVTKKKNNKLTLKLPENLYQGEVTEWEEKKTVVIPDLFAPKKERVQLGGRLIVDEEPKKKQKEEDASYLDSLQGAELNISVKMQ